MFNLFRDFFCSKNSYKNSLICCSSPTSGEYYWVIITVSVNPGLKSVIQSYKNEKTNKSVFRKLKADRKRWNRNQLINLIEKGKKWGLRRGCTWGWESKLFFGVQLHNTKTLMCLLYFSSPQNLIRLQSHKNQFS